MPHALVEEPRELGNRHPVAHRDRKLADERLEAFHEHRTVDLLAADGIRAIGDDDRHAVLPAGAQAVRHRVHEGVDARADVLQIDHEHVEPFSISAVGSRVSLYSEYTGTPRVGSCAWPVSIMLSCTSAR